MDDIPRVQPSQSYSLSGAVIERGVVDGALKGIPCVSKNPLPFFYCWLGKGHFLTTISSSLWVSPRRSRFLPKLHLKRADVSGLTDCTLNPCSPGKRRPRLKTGFLGLLPRQVQIIIHHKWGIMTFYRDPHGAQSVATLHNPVGF